MDRSSDGRVTTGAGTAGTTGIEDLEIRPVDTVSEYHACEELQRRTWGFDGDLDVIPLTQMMAVQKSGGLVLGAFDASGALGGFAYGFLGRDDDGTLLHHSHMTAVEELLRCSGLGARLKWAQRQAVLAQGLRLMIWTFDPLESLNAYFNFNKLGVVARRYLENHYGETTSALHRGMPTDRLRAEWPLDTERVHARHRGACGELAEKVAKQPGSFAAALSAAASGGDVDLPGAPQHELDDPVLTCEIPATIQAIKAVDPEAALAWRAATRSVLTHYLERGYEIRECVRTREARPRTLYVLRSSRVAGAARPGPMPGERRDAD